MRVHEYKMIGKPLIRMPLTVNPTYVQKLYAESLRIRISDMVKMGKLGDKEIHKHGWGATQGNQSHLAAVSKFDFCFMKR